MCCERNKGKCKKDRRVKPGECSPEQIHECQGTDGTHPCVFDEGAN